MKVFFSSSTGQLEKYFPIYKLICETIVDSGNELTRDWVGDALKVVKNDLKVNFKEMYEDILYSILDADVGIVECTVKGLSTGHQMTVALQKGKPLLCLHQNLRNDNFPFMVKGPEEELLIERIYNNQDEIPEIIRNFLESQKKGKKIRFNLVLTQQENNYLEWATFFYKNTKTDIIRRMIDQEIGADLNYQKRQKKVK